MSAGRAHGSVADETARLFEALQDAAATWSRGAAATLPAERRGSEEIPRECRVCPLCQVVAAVHEVRPETVRHLADAATSLLAALSDITSGMARSAGAHPPSPTAAGRGRPVDVQHIDITD